MSDQLKRDITGHCQGECRDLVLEAGRKFQSCIDASSVDYIESTICVDSARMRNEPPGFLGGHV